MYVRMKVATWSSFLALIYWLLPTAIATVTVTVRVPVGSCSAGGRRSFSGTATAVTSSIPGVSIASPSPVYSYSAPTDARNAVIIPSATAANGCIYQFVACLQTYSKSGPQRFTQTDELTTEYCATFCAGYTSFGLEQGSSCAQS